MDVVVVHYLFVVEHEVQGTFVSLFFIHVCAASLVDHEVSVFVVIVEYPSVIHGHILGVHGLDGRLEGLEDFIVLLVILLHHSIGIGIDHILHISDVFNVFGFQHNLGVNGEFLDHLEEPVQDTNEVDANCADDLSGGFGGDLVGDSGFDCFESVSVSVFGLFEHEVELADDAVVLDVVDN